MTTAPICLFVYNRPMHVGRVIRALQENPQAKFTDLIIFSDGPRDKKDGDAIASVRAYVRTITGFRTIEIIEHASNLGLAKSIIGGVTDVVNRYGTVIVVEDDLIVSPGFLEYMNSALELYKNDDDVVSVHGYLYPLKEPVPETFFLRGADCWGWATWKRGWNIFEIDGKKLLAQLKEQRLVRMFNFDNTYPFAKMLEDQIKKKNDSWAIRWYASAFLKNKVTLYPGRSLVRNIGFDGSGNHMSVAQIFENSLAEKVLVKKIPILEEQNVRAIFSRYFRVARRKHFYSRLRPKNLFYYIQKYFRF